MAAFSTADLVALWKRFAAKTWVRGLVSGIREQVLGGAAALFARISSAIDRDLNVQGHILTATGPRRAVGQVRFDVAVAVGADTDLEAPVAIATADGRRFVTTATATILTGNTQSNLVDSVSVLESFESNVDAEEISVVDEDSVDPVVLATLTGLTVTNPAAFAGGSAPVLDLHGRNAGLRRLANEADDQLRDRIRHAPDTVTPKAVLAAANRALQPGGKQAALDEPTPGLPPNANVNPQPTMGQFFADRGFFCDGGMKLQSIATTRACFTIRLPELLSLSPTTLYADRLRFLDRGFFADIGEPAVEAKYAGVRQAVEDAKAAGVLPLYQLDPNL